MKAKEVYQRFAIPQNLQEHMLRVTRVEMMIIDGWKTKIDKSRVIRAGLVHDLANIVKFKLDKDSELVPLQKIIIEKYGNDDHIATEKMLIELDLDKELIEIVQMKSFGNAIEVAHSDNWPLKILFYSDMRVMPTKVDSLDNRLNDVVTRLEKYRNHPQKDKLIQSAHEVEKQIQKMTNTNLLEITDSVVSVNLSDLLEIEI